MTAAVLPRVVPVLHLSAEIERDGQPGVEVGEHVGLGGAQLRGNAGEPRLEGTAAYKMRTYTGPSLLVIDELGYLPLDRTSANWIFQVVSRSYERGSIRADLQPGLRRPGGMDPAGAPQPARGAAERGVSSASSESDAESNLTRRKVESCRPTTTDVLGPAPTDTARPRLRSAPWSGRPIGVVEASRAAVADPPT